MALEKAAGGKNSPDCQESTTAAGIFIISSFFFSGFILSKSKIVGESYVLLLYLRCNETTN